MRRYRKEFFENKFQFRGSRQGKYERLMVLSDEELHKKACKWVHENAFKKGQPNMTAAMFTPPYYQVSICHHTSLVSFLFVQLYAGFTIWDLNLCRIKKEYT